MSERRKVRYSVGPLDFLKGDLSTVSLSSPLPLPPTSASSAISDGEFSADLVVVILSIEMSGSADLLKTWMKRR